MNSPWNNRRPSARPPRATPLPPSGARGDGSGPVRGNDELRLYGVNAVLAMHARRPQALRKLYLAEALIPRLQPLLKWCVGNRVGYRVVGEGDLNKLAATTHHEGVVADVLRAEPQPLAAWLAALDDGPVLALWLDGVGNPHNFGAILRSAAHFGVAAVLAEGAQAPALSGAACRVAEGGAEHVPLLRVDATGMALLGRAGFVPVATVVRGGASLHGTALPPRILWLLGAEGPGLSPGRQATAARTVHIPGSGAVDSLNVAAAAAVLFGEHLRQHPLPGLA